MSFVGKTIGMFFKDYRLRSGRTIEEVVAYLCLSSADILEDYEKGVCKIPSEHVFAMVNIYNISPAQVTELFYDLAYECETRKKRSSKTVQSIFALFLTVFGFSNVSSAIGQEIKTNAVHMTNAPKWVTEGKIDRVVDNIQNKMEWDIHRVEVHWYFDEPSFASANPLGSGAIAFTKHSDGAIYLGPKVTEANFEPILGHELVHVVSQQKYKGAIPGWLEEGLANNFSHNGKVDYQWLAKQPPISDIKELSHPYSGAPARVTYIYEASQALAEMIGSHCDLTDLLRMSVKRKMETYLANTCDLSDVNTAFKNWVKTKAAGN